MTTDVMPQTAIAVPTFTLARALRRLPTESATATKLAELLTQAEHASASIDQVTTASVPAEFLEEIWDLLPTARSLDARLADEIGVLIDKPLMSL